MKTDKKPIDEFLSGELRSVDIEKVERELYSLWLQSASSPEQQEEQASNAPHITRACSLNILAVTDSRANASEITDIFDQLALSHPMRAILVVNESSIHGGVESKGEGEGDLSAWVTARCHMLPGSFSKKQVCSEQITVELSSAKTSSWARLASASLPLVLGDLPVCLLWMAPLPSDAGQIQESISKFFRPHYLLVYDSTREARISPPDIDIDYFEHIALLLDSLPEDSVSGDLSWFRLTVWRQALSNAFQKGTFGNPSLSPDSLMNIERVAINQSLVGAYIGSYVESFLMVGWLACTLRWHLQSVVTRGNNELHIEFFSKNKKKIQVILASSDKCDKSTIAEQEQALGLAQSGRERSRVISVSIDFKRSESHGCDLAVSPGENSCSGSVNSGSELNLSCYFDEKAKKITGLLLEKPERKSLKKNLQHLIGDMSDGQILASILDSSESSSIYIEAMKIARNISQLARKCKTNPTNSANSANSANPEIPHNPEINIAEDPDATVELLAARIVLLSRETLSKKKFFSLVLSGGNTPALLYKTLASPGWREQIDWSRLILLLGDERCVPEDSAESNYAMIRRLLIEPLEIEAGVRPGDFLRPKAPHLDPSQAALLYEKRIKEAFALKEDEWPAFDCVLLGLGDDGHTASLFPDSPALVEKSRICIENPVAKLNSTRITLTYPSINHAAQIIFLVTGKSKAEIVPLLIEKNGRNPGFPASEIFPCAGGKLSWFLDRFAAGIEALE